MKSASDSGKSPGPVEPERLVDDEQFYHDAASRQPARGSEAVGG